MRVLGAIGLFFAVFLTACASADSTPDSDTVATVTVINDIHRTVVVYDCLDSRCAALADPELSSVIEPGRTMGHNVAADPTVPSWLLLKLPGQRKCLAITSRVKTYYMSAAIQC